jgi:hypothetical protein
MTLAGVLLGVLNIAIVVAILMLIGAVIVWFCGYMSIAVPVQVQRGYIVVVALIALYMLIALMLGVSTVHLISVAG